MKSYRQLKDGSLQLIEKDTPAQNRINVIDDIQPYKSMITGEIISSRGKHRDHLNSHGCIEIGNEFRPETKKFIQTAKEKWALRNELYCRLDTKR